MPYITWGRSDGDKTYVTYCTQEQMSEHKYKNSAFRNARGVKRRIGNGETFITRWGFRKSFPYPMDDKSFGTLPTPRKYLGLNNVVIIGNERGHAIHSRGMRQANSVVTDMKIEYNHLLRKRAPWKRVSEKKFLTVFRGFGYEPCDYTWRAF